jgi:1-phosphatidylinositol phosphodiesterase
MGQGGRILLVNKTPFRWTKIHKHSYQMNSWDSDQVFPLTIEPGKSVSAYVEWDEGLGKQRKTSGGETIYRLDGSGDSKIEIKVHGDDSGRYHSWVKFHNFESNLCKADQQIELGWWHNGTEVFVLAQHPVTKKFFAFASHQEAPTWMGFLDGNKKLTDLTIPGTHDTCSYTTGIPWAACQEMNVTDQLRAGIRYLDIRLKLMGDALKLYHGVVDLDLNFKDQVLADCYKFLEQNPGETILMSIKQEDASGPSIYEALKHIFVKDAGRWFLANNRVPLLDEVRGKIVLFRRFDGADVGFDNQGGWKDNDWSNLNSHGVNFRVQDRYDNYHPANVKDKWGDCVRAMLDDAKKAENRDWFFINFTSGFGVLTPPRTIAAGDGGLIGGTNAEVCRYMEGSLSGRYGIIPMDYPESPNRTLISLLVSQNF